MAPVHPVLAECAKLALTYSVVDLAILRDTLRTVEKQEQLVRAGLSKTMNSLHLPQASGYVHAVDIGVYEGRRLSWRQEAFFDVAEAMQAAARELDAPVTWGGCWAPLNGDKGAVELHAEYVARKARAGRRPFFDGPHFQLPRNFR